jgi:prepilin-type N-terminal cleavage/methylation domain-containing protein
MINKSFTVIELLVVIAIIGVLASIILVSLSGTRDRAQIAKTLLYSSEVYHSLGADIAGNWNFDEGSGTTAKDSSGYNNQGTIYGAVYSSSTPQSAAGQGAGKYALGFDGTNDYVAVSKNFAFQTIHGPSTLELWFNASSLSGQKFLFSDNCFEWGIFHSGTTIYGGAYSSVNGGTISTGQWYHAVLTHEHPTGLTNTKIRFYINGQLKGETTLTITTQNGYNDLPYYIGADVCQADAYFNGLIDEVRVYTAALTAAEIQQHYAEGLERHKDLAIK